MLHAAHSTLAECRERATKLVDRHRDAIIAFAGPLYVRRRIDGESLAQLLAEVLSQFERRSRNSGSRRTASISPQ